MKEPELLEREQGGWLAVSDPHSEIRIAVEGKDESEARVAFERAAARWQELAAAAKRRARTELGSD